MYPKSIKNSSKFVNVAYRISLPVTILLWLMPLAAVMMTSIRSIEDINQGNYWGIPSSFNFIENYMMVFQSTEMGQYLINSILIT